MKETPYKELLRVMKRKRDLCGVSLGEKIGLYALYAVRGIPFLLGLYL
ncbi:MAG: hypothetical protein JZD40_04375 [Sulfolobus sp.]|nr:hypothetical protein [Sulfolobus sp.]